MKPKLTCFVSCFNEQGTILKVLTALDNQMCPFEYEIVVYDDFSSDNSRKIIKTFCDNRDNFSFVFRDANVGLMVNLNDALQKTKAEFFIRNDGDDYSLPYRFTKLVSAIEERPEHAALGTAFYFFDYTNNRYHLIQPQLKSWICRAQLTHISPVNVGTAIWRVSALKQIGGFKHLGAKIEGFVTLTELSKIGRISNIKEALYVYNYGVKDNHRSSEGNFLRRDSAMVSHLKANNNFIGSLLWRYKNVILRMLGKKVIRALSLRKYTRISMTDRERIEAIINVAEP